MYEQLPHAVGMCAFVWACECVRARCVSVCVFTLSRNLRFWRVTHAEWTAADLGGSGSGTCARGQLRVINHVCLLSSPGPSVTDEAGDVICLYILILFLILGPIWPRFWDLGRPRCSGHGANFQTYRRRDRRKNPCKPPPPTTTASSSSPPLFVSSSSS